MVATIEIISPDLLPTGIIIFILSCVLCSFLMFLLGHLLLHKPSIRSPASRAFQSVPNSYRTFTVLLSVLLLFSMVAVGVYDHYLETKSARVYGYTPDGMYITPSIFEEFFLRQTVEGPGYKNFGFLKAVGIVPWLMNFSGLLLIIALWIGSDDAARFPDTVESPVFPSPYTAASPNTPSVPTELSGMHIAVDSSASAIPIITREKDVTDQNVATKEEQLKADAQPESAVTPKDPALNV
ncbi:hypothetical protein H1R20_g12254, partial [Candolleomyces eurysporus]